MFNLGAGRPVRLKDFIAQIEVAVGKPANVKVGPPRMGDVEGTWADIGKARERLGYNPKVTVAEGLRATAAWHAEYTGTGRKLYATGGAAAAGGGGGEGDEAVGLAHEGRLREGGRG